MGIVAKILQRVVKEVFPEKVAFEGRCDERKEQCSV